MLSLCIPLSLHFSRNSFYAWGLLILPKHGFLGLSVYFEGTNEVGIYTGGEKMTLQCFSS